jgi:AcrR family transcriptional regulator
MDTNRLPLREENKQRVTQRIISVAVSLFKAHGFHQTTMD